MVDTSLETAFHQLQLTQEDFFHPRNGYEWTHGVDDYWFYVVSTGRVPGIYTHWEEASQQVTAFPSAVHKKYFGWSAARSAYEITHPPKTMSPTHPMRRPKNSAQICAPSTPPPAHHPEPKLETRVSTPATTSGMQTAPSTPLVHERSSCTSILGPMDLLSIQTQEPSSKRSPSHTALSESLDSTNTDDIDDNNWLDVPDTHLPDAEATTRPKRKRKWYTTTDANLRHWVANFRDDYLRVLVTREGLMGQDSVCSCGQPAKYRCTECYGMRLLCRGCIVNGHITRPLCRIEAWNGTFFDRRELRHLGLRVQLCHSDNQPCPRGSPGRNKFVVIAPNGFHHVGRLLRMSTGWFQTEMGAAALIRLFARQNQAYHFFNALAKITDNTGIRRYQLALRVVRQWRNLRALKRGGELAVDCLACPKAGVNLPEGWERAPVEMRFLYTIFLAIDACFRLKRKKISSWLADPSLQDGWAYFVRSFTYEKFMSTCTGLAALDHANTKYSQGLQDLSFGPALESHERACTPKTAALQEFTQAQQDETPAWKKAVDDFEISQSAVNPYQQPQSGSLEFLSIIILTDRLSCFIQASRLRDVELELTREEQERELASAAVRDATEDTMTEYLMLGLEIEGQQRQLAADLSANKSPTTKELTDFVTRSYKDLAPSQEITCLAAQILARSLATSFNISEPWIRPRRSVLPSSSRLPSPPAESLPPLSVPGLAFLGDPEFSPPTPEYPLSGLVDGQQRKVDLGAATYRQARAARLKLEHVADEEEAKGRRQRAMKGSGKRRRRRMKVGNAGGAGGVVEEEMHNCVRVEWCKAYARVKEVEMTEGGSSCKRRWCAAYSRSSGQAGVWDRRAAAAHYTGKVVYRRCIFKARWHWQQSKQRCGESSPLASGACGGRSLTGFQGPMREHRPSHLGWTKTGSQVARETLKTSTETIPLRRMKSTGGGSGGMEEDGAGEGDGEEDGEGSVDREVDTDARRAEMDELLAMHCPARRALAYGMRAPSILAPAPIRPHPLSTPPSCRW
ncbi:hypothetical protein B0H14DRAFT_3464063 [Mycena olivaceomarginata]|nr:hypothetical protein B0H14DRAFT_3464063 [Mycena olivaceomarginata]